MTPRGISGARMVGMALLALAAAACTPSIEAQVYAVQSGYAAAMVPAAEYVELPECGTLGAMPPPGCSEVAVIQRIQDAVAIASPAIRAAQAEARRPAGNQGVVRAFLVTAKAALAALIAATPPKEPPS